MIERGEAEDVVVEPKGVDLDLACMFDCSTRRLLALSW